jgi:hypothetical protein
VKTRCFLFVHGVSFPHSSFILNIITQINKVFREKKISLRTREIAQFRRSLYRYQQDHLTPAGAGWYGVTELILSPVRDKCCDEIIRCFPVFVNRSARLSTKSSKNIHGLCAAKRV